MQKHIFLSFLFILTLQHSFAQNIEPQNGVYQTNHTYYAITNAKIYVSATETIENGTLIFKDGIIKKVGKLLKLPKNCVEINMEGFTIYPGFIDAYSSLAVKKRVSNKKNPYPQLSTLKLYILKLMRLSY